MKKQSNLQRLLGYAGRHRYLTFASWVLSAVSALLALVPYWYIWRIIREVLEAAPDFGRAQGLVHNGWMAVLFAVIAVLVYIAGLMCSHLGAFRIATNLRLAVLEHIVRLPLGAAEAFGSGRLRKIVNESSAATETYLAHQLPDRAGAIATPCGLLVLLFVFDWRLGLLSLAPVLLGFLIMMTMTGSRMQQKMKEYQNALDDMSNEAVEYVRGIPVVKTFGQTIFSFRKFKGSIDRYQEWVIAYTKELRAPMMFYTAAINGVFVFLTAGAILHRGGVSPEFLLNLLFYIIITPVISVTLTRIMFQSENAMIVDDALQRIDSVLNLKPLEETEHPRHPENGTVGAVPYPFQLRRREGCAEGYFTDHSHRTEGGFRGALRRRKDHPGQCDFPLLRSAERKRQNRRRGCEGHFQGRADEHGLLRIPEQPADQGLHSGKCADGQTGRQPGGSAGRPGKRPVRRYSGKAAGWRGYRRGNKGCLSLRRGSSSASPSPGSC